MRAEIEWNGTTQMKINPRFGRLWRRSKTKLGGEEVSISWPTFVPLVSRADGNGISG